MFFLEVNIPENNGFNTASELRQLQDEFTLIFLSEEGTYALEGYKYDAFRYMLKERIENDIKEAMEKYLHKSKENKLNEEQVAIKIKQEGFYDTILVRKQDIIFFEVDDKKRVHLTTVYGSCQLLILPLKKYKNKLQSDNFEIIMRSYLVNYDHVVGISEGYFILSNGERIHLGYSKRVRDSTIKKYRMYQQVLQFK